MGTFFFPLGLVKKLRHGAGKCLPKVQQLVKWGLQVLNPSTPAPGSYSCHQATLSQIGRLLTQVCLLTEDRQAKAVDAAEEVALAEKHE